MERTRALDSLTADFVAIDLAIGVPVSVDLKVEVVMVDSVVADSVAVDLKFVKPWVGYHLRTGDSSFRNTFRIKGKQEWGNGKEEVRY